MMNINKNNSNEDIRRSTGISDGCEQYIRPNPFGSCSIEGTFLYNARLTCTAANAAAVDMFGFDSEEIPALNILRLFAPGSETEIRELISSAEDANFEALMKRRDGSLFYGLIHKTVLPAGKDETWILGCQDISQAEEFRRESEKNREELESIFNNDLVGIGLIDKNRRITRANRMIARLAGCENPDMLKGRHMSEFQISSFEDEKVRRIYETELAAGKTVQFDHCYRREDGYRHWFRVSGSMVDRNIPPDPEKGAIWILDDINERREMEKRIFETSQELSTIFDNTMMGILVVRDERIIHRVNRQFLKIFGYESEGEWIGESVRKLHLSEEHYRRFGELHYNPLRNKDVMEVEFQLRRKDGSASWIAISGKALDPETPADLSKGVVWIIQDINERKDSEAELHRMATTDPLTNVLNRRSFTESGEREFSICSRYKRPVSLLMLDLDHFKGINDRYGHAAGDNALRFFTRICRQELRESDLLGRLGGEEFAVILLGSGPAEALSAAERIRTNLKEKSTGEDSVPAMTVSIGLATAGEGENMEAALHRADELLYMAKRGGRNRVCTA